VVELAGKHLKGNQPTKVNVKMAMLLKLACMISERDTFDDYRKILFYDLI